MHTKDKLAYTVKTAFHHGRRRVVVRVRQWGERSTADVLAYQASKEHPNERELAFKQALYRAGHKHHYVTWSCGTGVDFTYSFTPYDGASPEKLWSCYGPEDLPADIAELQNTVATIQKVAKKSHRLAGISKPGKYHGNHPTWDQYDTPDALREFLAALDASGAVRVEYFEDGVDYVRATAPMGTAPSDHGF